MEDIKETKQLGRPKKESSENRVRHTTSINDRLLKWFKHYAIEQGITTADAIEKAMFLYKYEKERNS
jgi:hypothetical protein